MFFPRIWGGTAILSDFYPHEKSPDTIGEAWCISGHPKGDCPVVGRNCSLSQLVAEDALILGKIYQGFPMQIRLLDSVNDLSVQVHPDDNYGHLHSQDNGKNEYWYILNAQPGASIVYGHTCKRSEDFQKSMDNLDDILCTIPVQKGDFIFIPTGLVHAMGKNITAIEVSDSSDTTYRVYDYNRTDTKGQKRELHVEHALKTIQFPTRYPESIRRTTIGHGCVHTILCDDKLYYTARLDSTKELQIAREHPYYCSFVLSGEGALDGTPIKKGDSFIIPNTCQQFTIRGNVSLLISYSKRS